MDDGKLEKLLNSIVGVLSRASTCSRLVPEALTLKDEEIEERARNILQAFVLENDAYPSLVEPFLVKSGNKYLVKKVSIDICKHWVAATSPTFNAAWVGVMEHEAVKSKVEEQQKASEWLIRNGYFTEER